MSASSARAKRGMPYAYGMVAAAALVLSAGCTSPNQSSAAANNGNAAPATGPTHVGVMPMGHAQLATPEGAPAGTARLRSVQGGVEIVLKVQGMAPGTHGFHIHEKGECAPSTDASGKVVAFGAAGGHFDPYDTKTHGHPGQPPQKVHAGDTPNLEVDASGQGTLRYTNTGVTLTPGPYSIAGRSLVVHASPDDYKTNPAGNSGARIACGLIKMTPADRADAGMQTVSRLGS